MTNATNNRAPAASKSTTRTDDLLASGTDAADGAGGFDSKGAPQSLQTGMEGIAGSTGSPGNRQSKSQTFDAAIEKIPDNPGQERNRQGG